MTSAPHSGGFRCRAVLLAGTALAGLSTVAPTTEQPAGAGTVPLPLGDPDLVEVRTVETLATGVTLTRIRRGTTPAERDQIPTTRRGPWLVTVLTIDRASARGHLRVTHGADLSRTEPTTQLVRLSGAVAGVNGSFFGVDHRYPGDPVGLEVYGGHLLSEPAPVAVAPHESDLLLDARTNRLSLGRHTWSGTVTNQTSRRVQRLEFVNHNVVVPLGCRKLVDPTRCTRDGDVSMFTRAFGARTPSGRGVEMVLSRSGCVVRFARTRGTTLVRRQWSLQATGRDTRSLLAVGASGCLSRSLRLLTRNRRRVRLGSWTFGVNGRHRHAVNGRVVVPTGSGSFYDRNPRTVVGTIGTRQVVIVTIDGRQPSSVGTTMSETAAVVGSLGLRQAVNLDGGGSTTMSVRGELVNQPSGTAERPVADALVYLDEPFTPR
jgi:hypothetical protein